MNDTDLTIQCNLRITFFKMKKLDASMNCSRNVLRKQHTKTTALLQQIQNALQQIQNPFAHTHTSKESRTTACTRISAQEPRILISRYKHYMVQPNYISEDTGLKKKSLQNGCAYPPGLCKMGVRAPMVSIFMFIFFFFFAQSSGSPDGDDVHLCSMICKCVYTLRFPAFGLKSLQDGCALRMCCFCIVIQYCSIKIIKYPSFPILKQKSVHNARAWCMLFLHC